MRLTDWTTTALMKVSLPARTTAMLLVLAADDEGRAEVRPDLLLATLYPKRTDPVTVDDLESHLLELDDAGFLTLYQEGGRSLLAILDPVRVDRPTASEYPSPPAPRLPRESSRRFVAVGGAGAEWAAWEDEQEREGRPERPLVLDAPPLGCPDHPNGRFSNCGPCGTARRRHAKWVAERTYEDKLRRYETENGGRDDDGYEDEF